MYRRFNIERMGEATEPYPEKYWTPAGKKAAWITGTIVFLGFLIMTIKQKPWEEIND
jgi:hypothetical protein